MSGGDVLTIKKLVDHKTGSDEKRKLGWKGDEEPQLLKSLFVRFEMKASERERKRSTECACVCLRVRERDREFVCERL